MRQTVLVYGDSNTHGSGPAPDAQSPYRLPYEDRWVNVMARDLGPDVRVIDEGMPGRTTVLDEPVDGPAYNGLRVLPAILASHAPIDLLVVMLGTNDLQYQYGFRTHDVARALERYVLDVRALGKAADLMLIAPVPVREIGTYAVNYQGAEARQKGMSEAIKALALRLKTGFFDAASVAEISPLDGVHLDIENHHKLGRAMARAVGERLLP